MTELTDVKSVEEASRQSIQSRATDESDVGIGGLGGLGGVFQYLFRAGETISPWWSTQRDIDLRRFVKRSDHLNGSIALLTSKVINVPPRVEPRDMSLKSHIKQADEYNQRFIEESEFGQGWVTAGSKWLEDYWNTDNGGFFEVIGDGKSDGPIKGPALGLAALDSVRVIRKKSREYPIAYIDDDGSQYKLHYTRVAYASDQPSPISEMYGVGLCAVSRAVNVAQHLVDIGVYNQEKLGSRPPRGLLFTPGIQADVVQSVLEMASEMMDNQALRRFARIPILGGPETVGADVKVIDFVSLPDGFDQETSTRLGMFAIALAFGVPIRWIWPAATSGATKADAMYQHIAGLGGGVGRVLKTLSLILGGDPRGPKHSVGKFLPPHLKLVFDFQDDEQDRMKADIRKTRMDTWATALETGATTLRVTREQMLEVGDISQSQFNQMELADGRLPSGEDVLTLFYAGDDRMQELLDLGVDDPLDVQRNDGMQMIEAIEDKQAEVRKGMSSVGSAKQKEASKQALAALGKLREAYEEVHSAQQQATDAETEEQAQGEDQPGKAEDEAQENVETQPPKQVENEEIIEEVNEEARKDSLLTNLYNGLKGLADTIKSRKKVWPPEDEGKKGGPGSGWFGPPRGTHIGGDKPSGEPVNTDSPEFKRWFGDSKIVDEDGEPRVLYHQTSKDSETGIYDTGFDVSRVGARATDARIPDGVFLKPTEEDIALGSTEKSEIAQIPLYVKAENPLIVKSTDHLRTILSDDEEWYEMQFEIERAEERGSQELARLQKLAHRARWVDDDPQKIQEFDAQFEQVLESNRQRRIEMATQARARMTQVLRDQGYDSVIIEEDVGSFGRIIETYIVFDPTQVKSALVNEGDFDPDDPRLTKQIDTKLWSSLSSVPKHLLSMNNAQLSLAQVNHLARMADAIEGSGQETSIAWATARSQFKKLYRKEGGEWVRREEGEKGGPGSGHHGHSGRPGKRGGSAPSGAAAFNAEEWLALEHNERREKWESLSSRQRDRLTNADKGIPANQSRILSHAGDRPEFDGDVKRSISNRLKQTTTVDGEDFIPPADTKMIRQTVNEFDDVLAGLDIDPSVRHALAMEAVDALVSQDREALGRTLGDHGIHHLRGNIDNALSIIEEHPGADTPEDIAATYAAQIFHDTGYLTDPSSMFLDMGHARWSSQHYDANIRPLVEQALGKRAAGEISHIIRTHADTNVDWEDDVVASANRVADNMALFHREKLPPLFRFIPSSTGILEDLGSGEISAGRARQLLRQKIRGSNLSDSIQSRLANAVGEVGGHSPKFILGMLGGSIGRVEWRGNHLNVYLRRNRDADRLQQVLDLGQRQFAKFAKIYGYAPEHFLESLKFEFKNPDGETVIESFIEEEKAFKGGPGSGHHGHSGRPGQRGGSSPGGGISAREAKIRAFEAGWPAKLYDRPIEVSYVLDNEGNQVSFKSGGESEVGFTREEAEAMKDKIMTHNHPVTGNSFSTSDVIFATQEANLQEIRAVGTGPNGKRYLYRLVRPENGWGWRDKDSITGEVARATQDVKGATWPKIRDGSISVDDANFNLNHQVMSRMAHLFRWEYSREVVGD